MTKKPRGGIEIDSAPFFFLLSLLSRSYRSATLLSTVPPFTLA